MGLGFRVQGLGSGFRVLGLGFGAHWLLHNGLLPYGRTHKACQLKPNFASVLGLVPPIVCQLYTTAGCGMCALCATISLQEPKAWVQAW